MSGLRGAIVDFVRGIGIEVREAATDEPCFLPGLDIRAGAVIVDVARWLYPGDLLHEAGHVAVATARDRLAPRLAPSGGDEMAAIAWSYAAAVHLDVAPEVVFHAAGYLGGGPGIAENFAAGRYFGVPLLAWYGMAIEPHRAAPDGPPPYPHLLRWLR
jgi:hypothetical protein